MGDDPLPRASDMLMSEKQRLELMELVKASRISPEEATKRIVQIECRAAKAKERDRREKEEQIARMTPKARQQEKAKMREREKEERAAAANRLIASPTSYVSHPAAPGTGSFAACLDLRAEEMKLTDLQRVEVMSLVKSGELTVEQAMRRVRLAEQALREQESAKTTSSTEPLRRPSLLAKHVRFSSDAPSVGLTFSTFDYDRSHPDDYDPEFARREWAEEEEEEKERQLEIRWQALEENLPDGQKCDERIEYTKKKHMVADLEAAAAKKHAERRRAEKARIQEARNRRKRDSDNAKLAEKKTEHLLIEAEAKAARALLATQERLAASQMLVIEKQVDLLTSNIEDVCEALELLDPDLEAGLTDESGDDSVEVEDGVDDDFIAEEMRRLREEARQRALDQIAQDDSGEGAHARTLILTSNAVAAETDS